MEKLKMHSPNFAEENIAKLVALFPGCVTESTDEEGKPKQAIDFDLLRQELASSIVEGPQERYHLNWPGKRKALLAANAPIAKTLRPCREESMDFDTTENLFIEGDNLDALKLLQETYLGKVKIIYIDPPYNTGKDFIYADKFTMENGQWKMDSGDYDKEGNRLVANTESNGRFHSDWLSMMYSRLKLARNLLKDDGVIVIHIDENEYPNLEKILSEIFGEENNLGTIVWDKRNPKGEVAGVAQQHELLSIYSKNKTFFKELSELKRPKENAQQILKKASDLIRRSEGINETIREDFRKWISAKDFSGGEKAYSLIDDDGKVYQSVSMAAPDKPETRSHRPLIHPVTKNPCSVPAKGWRFPDETMDILLERKEIVFGIDDTTQPRRKYLLSENLYENVPSLLYFGGSDDALGLPFDNPKPVLVAKQLLESVCKANDIILDFFAGSATTAHAVMQLNAEDGGKRKFIMVQLPEACNEKTEAFKAGYKTIAEISKERIRRAGKKIKEEHAARAPNLDTGFRVLKIDSSNMADVYYTPDAVKQNQLKLLSNNIKDNRSPEDLLFQVLLDWGVDLTLPISREIIKVKKDEGGRMKDEEFEVFFVDGNALVACFEKDGKITEDFCKELAGRQPLRVVFRDSGFKNDSVKINVEQIFKLMSPHTDVKAI
ncbi:MAG: site-specific DNA-methyltransferase [Spirochaeta sp. LUC14_002_19_P3]|nr:MAG: site-specific DNA-methyltransferase [Spirochaeta sp. LUC14_002_19_P3]